MKDIEDICGGNEHLWEEQLGLIREMREGIVAPVDTMGCMQLADKTRPPNIQRFQTLIALMLSSQTKDQITAAAINRLNSTLPDGLCIPSIIAIDQDKLAEQLCPVGFYRIKAKNIKETAAILRDSYDGDVPSTIEELVKLPGVGPKMGYLTLHFAWGINSGIGVDVHVHRIAARLGWVDAKKCKTPEDTRKVLQNFLAKSLWPSINPLLVGFGQTVCLPLKPKCSICLVRKLCPFGSKQKF